MPEVPDLEALNLSFVEWLEDVFQDSPNRNTLNDTFEEEDEHWTNIARNLSKQQLKELDERIKYLDAVRSGLKNMHTLNAEFQKGVVDGELKEKLILGSMFLPKRQKKNYQSKR